MKSAVQKLADQGIQQLRNSTILPLSARHTAIMRRQPAQFWRGGTSNGVMIAGSTLPEWQVIRDRYLRCTTSNSSSSNSKLDVDLKQCADILQPIYQAIFGSPDPYGRQLNGMGGGLSSLSKAVIVDESMSDDFDLDYLFIQIGIRDGKLDLAGNCGNMTSAVAPFALQDWQGDLSRVCRRKMNSSMEDQSQKGKIIETSTGSRLLRPVTFQLRNLNTDRGILAEVMTSRAADGSDGDDDWCFEERGDYVMDGVPGYASPIVLSFTEPGGAKTGKALPTGNAIDAVEYEPGSQIMASLSDISNPGVFLNGREVGWDPERKPDELNADGALMQKLEAIRRKGASMMGMNPDTPSVPKVVMLFSSNSDEVDITCQALSMEQAHKAVPMTLGLNLGVACKIPGTIANKLARHRDPRKTVVGHPSGRVEVGANISSTGEILSAQVIRTARCLMEGFVNVTRNEKLDIEC